jgi:hypothetical protein
VKIDAGCKFDLPVLVTSAGTTIKWSYELKDQNDVGFKAVFKDHSNGAHNIVPFSRRDPKKAKEYIGREALAM